jgi:biopolymer transport protein ExbD
MAKVKIPRKSTSIDMTPMVDLGFLLLTFFILTAQFRPEEPVVVNAPSSISDIPIPDTDIMTISIGKNGEIFFGVDAQPTRKKMLQAMGDRYGIQFTEEEAQAFSLSPAIGVPVAQLKELLKLEPSERAKPGLQTGIPCDSATNELRDWVAFARYSHPKAFRVAIKGDRESNYKVAKEIIATLQAQNYNRINLITGMEARPQITE